MRASRLLSLLMLLQAKGRTTASDLAAVLEVSTRTVYRDIDALSAAGVPVATERGPGGGCYLVGGFRTRLTGLTDAEAESVLLAGLGASLADLGLGDVVAGAERKLLAALPAPLRGRASRSRDRVHFDPVGWFRTSESSPWLPALAAAVWNDRQVRVSYGAGARHAPRTLDPLGLVLKAGVWYLVARAARTVRTYRVSRIADLVLGDERFDRPAHFDLGESWRSAVAEFEAALPAISVTVRAKREAVRWLGQTLTETTAEATLASIRRPDPRGWTVLELTFESLDEAERSLLTVGPTVEVLEPAVLRERVRTRAAEITALYSRKPARRRPL